MAIHYRFSWFWAMPVFIAVGLLSGKKLARWIAVLSTVISLIMIFVDSELYSNGKIITQCIIQGILMFLLFNPTSNRYFQINKSTEQTTNKKYS